MANDVYWNCPRCTFEQSPLNEKCIMCGEQNKFVQPKSHNSNNNKSISIAPSQSHNNNEAYGRIVYQTDRFTEHQLTQTYLLYVQNPDIKTSNWCIYLFGDNDIDSSRPPNTDREMIGGLGIILQTQIIRLFAISHINAHT